MNVEFGGSSFVILGRRIQFMSRRLCWLEGQEPRGHDVAVRGVVGSVACRMRSLLSFPADIPHHTTSVCVTATAPESCSALLCSVTITSSLSSIYIFWTLFCSSFLGRSMLRSGIQFTCLFPPRKTFL